jgi:hypothetical protein
MNQKGKMIISPEIGLDFHYQNYLKKFNSKIILQLLNYTRPKPATSLFTTPAIPSLQTRPMGS